MIRRAGCIAFLCFFCVLWESAAEEKPIQFTADRMSGAAGKKNESTRLEGNAVVLVGSLKISGDLIELSGKDYRMVTATGNVSGRDSEKDFSFTSQQLTYDRDLEVASFTGKATLSDTKNKVEASAGMITWNQKTEVALLQTKVKLVRKEIDCTATFALYRRQSSMLDLTGSPRVLRSGDEFMADRITVNLDTEFITLDGAVSGSLKEEKKTDAAKVSPLPDTPKGGEVEINGESAGEKESPDKVETKPVDTTDGSSDSLVPVGSGKADGVGGSGKP